MYKYLFGPVLSRRLGVSLGVDLLPKKICSFNCIYCECGPTKKLTLKRDEYVPTNKVIEELKDYIEKRISNKAKLPQFITFSGQGEPTLHSGLGKIISFLKDNYPFVNVALITNSSLLWDNNLREEIKKVDVILPSLDAVTETVFTKINRPLCEITPEKIIKGLIELSRESTSKIWLEIFIVPGINTDTKEIVAIKKVIERIKPHKVQINSIDRPPIYKWIRKPTEDELSIIKKIIPEAEIISSEGTTIPKSDTQVSKNNDLYYYKTIIKELVKRRPQTIEELNLILGLNIETLKQILHEMDQEKTIQIVKGERGDFVIHV